MRNKISNDDSFKNYVGKYIALIENGIEKKYYVSEINKSSILTNVEILNNFFSILGMTEKQTCENKYSITWNTTYDGTLSGNPWVISNSGRNVIFDIEDSIDCGGNNANTQTGTASADILIGKFPVYMTFNFSGNVEHQNTDFENMLFYLNEQMLGYATSRQLFKECIMGEPLCSIIIPMPYFLSAYSENNFKITFTTGDALWHKNAFYNINLQFFYDSTLTQPITSF